MIGLVVRIGLLCAVVFAVVYAVVRARRLSAHGRAARRVQEEVRLLKAGLEEGLYSDEEYRRLRDSIRAACDEQGIEIPELPPFIRPEKEVDGGRGES
jgi:hypothetical protein